MPEKKQINIKKAERPFTFSKCDGREPLVSDLVNAEDLCGKTRGHDFVAALMAVTCTFDGKPVQYEDIKRMTAADFFDVSRATAGSLPKEVTEDSPAEQTESSTSNETEASGGPK